MSDDSDPVDGAHDLDRFLDQALQETAVRSHDEAATDVLVLPVGELSDHDAAAQDVEALAATVDDRNEQLRTLVRTVERQEDLLADLTARIGDLEARLEAIDSMED